MSNVLDVQNALVALVAQSVYPNGTGAAPATGCPVRIYPGWPNAATLDADLSAGTCHISVFPTAIERNTTRYSTDWAERSVSASAVTLTINNQQITVGGTVPAPFSAQNYAVLVNGKLYSYALQAGDTITSIATALAALIAADVSGTTNTGSVITVGATGRIARADVGGSGVLSREIRRQERVFMVSIWANTPDTRAAIVQVIDTAMAKTPRLSMSDGYSARMIYRNSNITDDRQKAILYRCDLNYSVEFATTETVAATQVIAEQLNIAAQQGATQAQISTITVNQ